MPYHRPIPGPDSRHKRSGALDALVQAEKMIQIALILPCAAFIGWLGGAWLDRWLHQKWLSLAGIAFGGIAGLVYVVRLALAAGNAPPGGDGNRKGPAGKEL